MTTRTAETAIIGMACLFPGAPDLESYRQNIVAGVDAITEVPPERWEPVFYDPDSDAPDRLYCRRGGFVDRYATFDALGFGVMPVAAEGAEPDQLLALRVAAEAMEDAGYGDRPFARERTGVILGRGNYIGAGQTRLEQHVRTAQQLVECLRTLVPGLSEDQLASVKGEFQQRLGRYGPDTAIGLVPNLTASRVANRLDLHGPAYSVDGACASSLLAVDLGVQELRSGRADLVLAGGVHLCHDVSFWSIFCQLGALSRSQRSRPFHARADGLLAHRVLALLLGADEHHGAAALRDVAHERVGLLQQLERLLQVDDVDAGALTEDEALHLGVPPAGLVAEVHSGLQQLLHGDDGHASRLLVRLARKARAHPGGTDHAGHRPPDPRARGRDR